MADDPRPPKKVVKRVVKKPATPPADKPTIRYGRPADPAPKPALKTATTPPKPVALPKAASAKKRIDVGDGLKSAGSTAAGFGRTVASGAGRGARAVGGKVGAGASAVARWRIPHIEPKRAAAITGLVVGLLGVSLGWLAKIIFNEVRGVSSGGGTWGSLTFVVVAFAVFIVGERLLAAFGLKHAAVASFLGTVIAITAILAVLLDVSDSVWAFAVVPALGAATYTLSHWLLDLADKAPVPVD